MSFGCAALYTLGFSFGDLVIILGNWNICVWGWLVCFCKDDLGNLKEVRAKGRSSKL